MIGNYREKNFVEKRKERENGELLDSNNNKNKLYYS